MKLAIFGHPFSHTDQASFDFNRDQSTEVVHFPAIFEVFEAVANDEVDGGIVPYENSTRGALFETLDELFDNDDISIVSMREREINQCLLVLPEADVSGIKAVLSHPQALAQARKNLYRQYPRMAFKPRSSTALAAGEILERQDLSLAAIGSPYLADQLGLKVIGTPLEEDDNRTKFVFISRNEPDPKAKHTSMVCWFSADKSGNLASLLMFFSDHQINLTKLDSRRAPSAYGGYLFFIDLDCPKQRLDEMFDELQNLVEGVKILGTY